MNSYDAIIIGGGVNGLVAGAVLGRRGKKVCIVERSSHFGGMASLSVDGGPDMAHTLYNLSPVVLKDLGIEAQADALRGAEIPTVSLCKDGRHIVFDHNTVTWIDGTPHPDAAAWADLNTRLTTYAGLLRQMAEAPPPGGAHGLMSRSAMAQVLRLAKLGLGIKKLGKPEMRRFLQVLLSNAHDLILDEIPDGPVAGMLAADAVRGAAAGPRSPGTVFNLIYRLGHGGIVTHPTGGMTALTDLLAQTARAANCTLMNKTDVADIVIENDAVTGVVTATGDTLTAPVVLSSLAPGQICQMLGPDHLDIETTRRIRNIRARGTTAKVNFLLDGDAPLPGLPDPLSHARMLYAPSADYVETAFNPAKYGQMSKTPVIEAMRTQTRDGSHWLSTTVQYAPVDLDGGWSDDARTELGQLTRETLGQVLPGLADRITGQQVISPDQIEQATGAPGGHWHHAEMSLDQVLSIRPANGLSRYAMGPTGLFLCGASAHPGGDVMGLAGRNGALTALEGMS